MERKDLIRDVIHAAADFQERKLWKRFTNFDCFAVRCPGKEDPLLACVMGDAGEQYGLMLLRGPHAAESFSALTASDGPGDDATEAMDMLSFSMDAFGDMAPESQAFLRQAGIHPRHNEQIPGFLVKPPGRQPRMPNDSELALLLTVLKVVVAADRKKLLQPATLDDKDGICVVTVGGDLTAPAVSVRRERLQRHQPPLRAGASTPTALDLAGLEVIDATWLVGAPVMPAGIKGDDRSMQLLLIVDDASEYIFHSSPVFADQTQEAVTTVVETFRGHQPGGRKCLPQKIVFSSRKLHDAMAPALEQSGVKCIFMPVIPKLQGIAAEFLNLLGQDLPPLNEHLEQEDAEEDRVPAPDDLAGWKAADKRLFDRCVSFSCDDPRLRLSRAVKRYFGDDDLDRYLTEHKDQGVAGAYTAWGILDYRPAKNSKTRAEQMVIVGLAEPEATLLLARMQAHPTLYRIAGHDPKAGTVDLEDVLLGGAVAIHDQLLSENIDNGLFVTARVFPAGRFHFLELAGPPLGAGMGMEAVDFLRQCGMEFTHEGLLRDAHLFGRLWHWIEWWEANWRPPQLRNTDGDELLWHTASFTVACQPEVRQALLRREDIEHDEEDEEFVWVAKKGQGAKTLGGPVTLGRIEFVGDELVLSVNSAKRFATARKWLETLPGVVFEDVTTRRLNEPAKDRPLDERISKSDPVEMTPELTASLQEMMNKQYMAWLDMPLPVLRGKTPREACQTPDGRRQVTMMIRTTPDPTGPAPVRVPRQAMLRELGLADESSTAPVSSPRESPLPEPPAAGSPDGKVGRNDPCPCGSGRKYKKCCGR